MEYLSIDDKLAKIESTIKEPSFLENKGLSGEVPYYVFDYEPKYELKVREEINHLINKINSNTNNSFKILEFDLYDIMIEILKEEDYLDMVFEFEKEEGLEFTKDAIIDLFKLDSDENVIVQYILQKVESGVVVFLTGVGKAYPILRSHNVLNALSQQYTESPVVLFFPGTFSGINLQLFNTLKKSNYYRVNRLIR